MFRMMTPIDAIGLGLRAGMIFGQTQTLWVTRMMEMQGFWAGFPRTATEPATDEAPPVTELHIEAMVAEPVVEVEALAEVAEAALADVETPALAEPAPAGVSDRKSTRLNSSH